MRVTSALRESGEEENKEEKSDFGVGGAKEKVREGEEKSTKGLNKRGSKKKKKRWKQCVGR